MSRLLVTLWDGGGNVPPVLSVVAALVRGGHDVRVLTDRVLGDAVLRTDARHVAWTTAPQRDTAGVESEFVRDFEARTPIGANARIRDRLLVGPAGAYAADVRAEIRREPVDAVISETLLFGSQIAAEAEGVPNMTLVPNLYPGEVRGVPPFGPGLMPRDDALGRLRDRIVRKLGKLMWDKRLGELNTVRGDFGLPPVASAFEMLDRPDRVLVLTSASFEFSAGAQAPDNIRYCGPRLEDPGWTERWEPPPGDDPLVLVSLSTTTQNQGPMILRVVEALGRLPVRGLVTAGPSYSADDLDAPANVMVVSSAPHSQVLPHAAAVVTHAGHGTVIKALSQGVPLVCMPVGRDQPDTAARVVAAGAGVRIRAGSRPAGVERALRSVLEDPSYRKGAERIASAIAADRACDLAVDEIEDLLGV